VTEASKKKAQKAAKRLAGRGGATAVQLQAMAEDLVTTSVANREALTKLVRYEVDRALGVVGLATAEEVGELTKRVHDLERQLQEAEAKAVAAMLASGTAGTVASLPPEPAAVDVPATTAAGTVPTKSVAQKAVAKKVVAKKAVAKKTVAKKAVAKTTVAPKAGPANGSVVAPAPAKTAPAKAGPAKAVPAKSAPAKAAPAKAAPAETAGAPATAGVKKAAKKAVAKKAAPPVAPLNGETPA
jgi:polyhydroxyalkanoate synthesis regulator phasin